LFLQAEWIFNVQLRLQIFPEGGLTVKARDFEEFAMGKHDVSRSRWYMLFRTASRSRMEMVKPELKNAKSTNNFAGLSVDRDSISDPALADFLEH
jgi:hypothetical protein